MRKIILLMLALWAIEANGKSFQLIALGVNGGITDGNLSAYLIAPTDDSNYAAFDAGTLTQGLEKAETKHSINYSITEMLTKHIPVYLISHAHLDHIVGFAIAQPELRDQQTLMARKETLQALQKYLFSPPLWLNFGDTGAKPALKFQHYQILPLMQWLKLPNTAMTVEAFPLNHGNGYPSTAFLIQANEHYVLYFGDTGADKIEHDNKIENIWNNIAPLIRQHKLHAILLECSFPNSQPDNQLFGHLKPSLYLDELTQLAHLVDPTHPENALNGITIFVTHIKPSVASLPTQKTAELIYSELQQGNHLRVKFVIPQQGEKYIF